MTRLLMLLVLLALTACISSGYNNECPTCPITMFPVHPKNETLSLDRRDVDIANPMIIPVGKMQTHMLNAYNTVIRQLKRSSSNVLIYPFSFDAKEEGKDSVSVDEGAFIALEDQKFDTLKTLSLKSIKLRNAKAVYDSNIAILLVETTFGGGFRDLTYEASKFCSSLHDSISSKWADCYSVEDFLQQVADIRTGATIPRIVYVTPKDINDGILMKDGSPLFGNFIIPDIYQGSEKAIASLIKSEKIKEYVSLGGHLYASNKGIYVAAEFGLTEGLKLSANSLLGSRSNQVLTEGCPKVAPKAPSNKLYDWAKAALCFGVPRNEKDQAYTSLTTTPKVDSNTGFTVISHFAANPEAQFYLADRNTGVISDYKNTDVVSQPHILSKKFEKGFIILDFGNSIATADTYPWFYNAYFYANSKPLFVNTKIKGKYLDDTFPALEQISLVVDVSMQNLFDVKIGNFAARFWYAKGVKVTNAPSICKKTANTGSNQRTVPHSFLDSDEYYLCGSDSLDIFEKLDLSFTVKIEDITITQRQYGIVIAYPEGEFTDPQFGTKVVVDNGPVLITAKSAASIRAEINVDPIGVYPVPGTGSYHDNVFTAENKEATEALEVKVIEAVPLISPFFNGVDSTKVSVRLTMDYLYYMKEHNSKADYKYPFTVVATDTDYVDYYLFAKHHNVRVQDWDSPVKKRKVNREVSINPEPSENDYLEQYPVSTFELQQQQFFQDHKTFYEMAEPRVLAFLDLSDPESFKHFNKPLSWKKFSSNAPPSWMKATDEPPRLKTELLFARVDSFFYKTHQKMPLPKGVKDHKTIFSIDRWAGKQNTPCKKFGEQTSVLAKSGYYGNAYNNVNSNTFYYPPGLEAGEFTNALKNVCDYKIVGPNDVESETDGGVKLAHYIIPLVNNDIKKIENIMYFVKDNANSEEVYYYDPAKQDSNHGTYKELKALYVYNGKIEMDQSKTRRGGKIVFDFSKISFHDRCNKDNDCVTIQHDHVASGGYKNIGNSKTEWIFKRGNMPNEAYSQKSVLGVNLEGVKLTAEDITISAELFALDYALGDTGFKETYTKVETLSIKFIRTPALSLPSLEFEFDLRRGDSSNESTAYPYESFEPVSRVGTYSQELRQHATVFCDPEVHINKPEAGHGVVGKGANIIWLTALANNPIPFVDLMKTGSSQLTPSVVTNSQIQYKDFWGRQYSQPVRTLLPDNAPIPSPILNFMMSSTFEILDKDSTARSENWQSDEKKVVRVQMKMENNYPKFFDMAACAENGVYGSESFRVYDGQKTPELNKNKNYLLHFAHDANYGACLGKGKLVLEGKTINDSKMRDNIKDASMCLTSEGDWYKTCPWAKEVKDNKYPKVCRPGEKEKARGTNWQYMELVDKHYPKGFISDDMWDLTHPYYYDDPFDLAFDFHLDNLLPGLHNNSPSMPHNMIAFPIYKGLGFKTEFRFNLKHPKFPYEGWWSDNLQNRDDTLLGGQKTSNNVSVGQKNMIEEDGPGFIDGFNLEQAPDGEKPTDRLKNMYACLFNRRRVKVNTSNEKTIYPNNVYENNIIPINPTLTKGSKELVDYDCKKESMFYTPNNISQFKQNLLLTESSSNWLYFGANLRGGAKETINVLYEIQPLSSSSTKEGPIKIAEGGRFTYWNPAFGPNTFAVVDNLATVINSIRTDVEVKHDRYPTQSSTFNSTIIHQIEMADKNEIDRAWDLGIYYNYHGFGDAATSTYVGGYDASKSIVSPGQTTYVEIVFYNNAGFDWNLYAKAIDFDYKGSEKYNANGLMYNYASAIKAPKAFKFLTLTFEEPELAQYVTIEPSQHNINTAPLWFDYESINVATIRDGFKGRYFYQLKIANNLPVKFRGKLHHVKVKVNSEYFDRLPGQNDPVPENYRKTYHDYKLTVPDIVFGIPYEDSHPLAGQVRWTSGHAYDLKLTHRINKDHKPIEACFVGEKEKADLINVIGSSIDQIANMKKFWESVSTKCEKVPFTEISSDGDYTTIQFDFKKYNNVFPFDQGHEPEKASVTLMINTFASQVPTGRRIVTSSTKAEYTDDKPKSKSHEAKSALTVNFVGPYLSLDVQASVFDHDNKPVERDVALDVETEGYVKLRITATNIGNKIAYSAVLTFNVPHTLTLTEVPQFDDYTVGQVDPKTYTYPVSVNTKMNMVPGASFAVDCLFSFTAVTVFDVTDAGRLFLHSSAATFELNDKPGAFPVTQDLQRSVVWPVVGGDDDSTAWFAIIGLPIILFVVFALIAIIVAAAIHKRRNNATKETELENNTDFTDESNPENVTTTVPKKTARKPMPPPTQSNIESIGPDGRPKFKVANTTYLMTGGVLKVVKDGNPTALDNGEESSEESDIEVQAVPKNSKAQPKKKEKKEKKSGGFFSKMFSLFTCEDCR